MANNCIHTVPFWSVDTQVYHTCLNCPEGQKIPEDKKNLGRDQRNLAGRRLCKDCQELQDGKVVDNAIELYND
jgi:hypothetical protein